jgi:hypothetical protein
VRRHLSAGEVQVDARPDLEICCVHVQLCDVWYRIFGVNRPPDSEILAEIAECLRRYACVRGPCVIVGDLNCPGINWQISAVSRSTHGQNDLLDFVITSGFQQLVTEPTRVLNLLNVVLTNNPIAVCE